MAKEPHILICDDDLEVLESLKMLLKDRGYELYFVTNGPRALEIIKTKRVDLFLLDVIMPKMSGMDVLKEVEKIKPTLKIIIITALLHEGVALELYRYGMVVDVITKPLDKNKTLEIIAEVLRKE